MPDLIKKVPNLKLVITGGGYKKKFPWLIDQKIVSKDVLYNLISFATCMCVPLEFGSGTRIKIIEALMLGAVLSTKKGIEGINISKNSTTFVSKIEKFSNYILFILKNEKKLKLKANKNKLRFKNLLNGKYYKNIF